MGNRDFIITVVFSAALTACGSDVDPQAVPSDLGCHRDVAALSGLRGGLSVPPYLSEPNPVKRGGEFDPNRYFQALPHLRMRDGFTLDWVYHQDGMGGYPILYARPVDRAPFADEAAYTAAGDQPPYLSFVVPQDSAEGYFEYGVLALSANQFYLDWHANYNDWQVVCGADGIEAVIASRDDGSFGRPMSTDQQRQARAITDPLPAVVLNDRTATVTMLVFTKWGGFFRRTLEIDRRDHSIRAEADVPVVSYDCGVAF